MTVRRKRDIRALVEQAGLSLLSIDDSSGHLKARIAARDGRTGRQVFAKTPSDHRGDLNKLACLRRFANNMQGRTA